MFVKINAQGPSEWHSSLRHCIAVLEVSLQTCVQSQDVSQLAMTGRPMRQSTIGPVFSGLGEGLAGRDFLVPSRSSDSCGGPGAVHAAPGLKYCERHFLKSFFIVLNTLCVPTVQ